jgi:hypothetical protein
MGRYLLDGGRGASRPKFFKLMDGFDAKSVIDSARYVEQKLTHIKLACHIITKSCALIVTEKVGAQDARPSSLEAIFIGSEPGRARKVALQIADQVQQLGDLLPESKPLKELFWPGHDIALLTEQWNRFAPQMREQLGHEVDPVSLFLELLASEIKQRITERSLVHGDLHMSCQGRSKTRPVGRSKSRPVVGGQIVEYSGEEGRWSVAEAALLPRGASRGEVQRSEDGERFRRLCLRR